MKKVFCALLTLAILLLLCSCAPAKLPQICQVVDSVEGVEATVELTIWDGYKFTSEEAPKSLTVDINGVSVTGEYSDSDYVMWTPVTKNNYIGQDSVEFGVDGEGTVVFYANPSPSECTEDITSEKATEIASDFIKSIYPGADLGAYKLSASPNSSGDYSVSYIKYIGDRITFDHVNITITAKGGVKEYQSYIFGKITEDTAKGVDKSRIRSKVVAKCDQIAKEAKKIFSSVSYDDYSYVLTIDETGRAAYIVLTEILCLTSYDVVATSKSMVAVLYFSPETLG